MRSKNCRRRRESIFLSSLVFCTIVSGRERERKTREEGKYRLSLDLFFPLADVFHSRPIDEFIFVWDGRIHVKQHVTSMIKPLENLLKHFLVYHWEKSCMLEKKDWDCSSFIFCLQKKIRKQMRSYCTTNVFAFDIIDEENRNLSSSCSTNGII